MARVNAFLRAGNDAGREVSVGGRGKSDRCWAILNTDNAGSSDCSLHVKAEVVGERQAGGAPRKTCSDCGHKWQTEVYDADARDCPDCGTRRQGVDTRVTHFTVELPDQADKFCEIRIEPHGERFAGLIQMGALLCGVKAADQAASGEQAAAMKTIKGIEDILNEVDKERRNLPRVTLPGGIELGHALACVTIVQNIIAGKGPMS